MSQMLSCKRNLWLLVRCWNRALSTTTARGTSAARRTPKSSLNKTPASMSKWFPWRSRIADSCRDVLWCVNRRALIWYLLPSESTASRLGFELPACSQLNALQKRYSPKSPTVLFALRVMPLLRSSLIMRACKAKRSYAGSFAISVIVNWDTSGKAVNSR